MEYLVDSERPLSDGLSALYVLASRFRTLELKQWIDKELSGYGDDEPVPSYRILSNPTIRLTFDGPVGYPSRHRLLQPYDIPAELRIPESGLSFRQPLVALEGMSRSPQGSRIPLPDVWIQRYRQVLSENKASGFHMLELNEAEIQIPSTAIESVVSSIRVHALKLTTAIDELNGEEKAGEPEESRNASLRQEINNYVQLTIYNSAGGPIDHSPEIRNQRQINFNAASSLSTQGDGNVQDWSI